jgi:hypothetical protein
MKCIPYCPFIPDPSPTREKETLNSSSQKEKPDVSVP